jgi:RNA polymerase sigma-70 factor (ECF subfamily)
MAGERFQNKSHSHSLSLQRMTDPTEDFRSKVAALLPRLRRFALALAGSPHDADDLVQSAVERALSREEQWRPDTRLDSWMYRIVQNLWIDHGRRRRTCAESPGGLEDALHLSGEDGRETAERRLMLRQAWAAFETLAPELRAAASLVILNGMSYQEAAETLEVPIGTIMSRISRSRRALEEAFGGEGRSREAAG